MLKRHHRFGGHFLVAAKLRSVLVLALTTAFGILAGYWLYDSLGESDEPASAQRVATPSPTQDSASARSLESLSHRELLEERASTGTLSSGAETESLRSSPATAHDKEGTPVFHDLHQDALDVLRMSIEELESSEYVNPWKRTLSDEEREWLSILLDSGLEDLRALSDERVKVQHSRFREVRDAGLAQRIDPSRFSGEAPKPEIPGQMVTYSFKGGETFLVRINPGEFPEVDQLVNAERDSAIELHFRIIDFFNSPFPVDSPSSQK